MRKTKKKPTPKIEDDSNMKVNTVNFSDIKMSPSKGIAYYTARQAAPKPVELEKSEFDNFMNPMPSSEFVSEKKYNPFDEVASKVETKQYQYDYDETPDEAPSYVAVEGLSKLKTNSKPLKAKLNSTGYQVGFVEPLLSTEDVRKNKALYAPNNKVRNKFIPIDSRGCDREQKELFEKVHEKISLIKVPVATRVFAIVQSKIDGIDPVIRVPCMYSKVVGNCAYDRTCDSVMMYGKYYHYMGEVDFSFNVKVRYFDNAEVEIPMPLDVFIEHLSVDERKQYLEFKEKNAEHNICYQQMRLTY